jgi:hypothetical protein
MRLPSIVALICVCAILSACGSAKSEPSPEAVDQAYENADDQLAGASFEDVGDTSQCTEDCSGHYAGFNWAREQGVTDSSDCSGDSDSFVEGCEAYVDAREEAADEQLQSDGGDEDR